MLDIPLPASELLSSFNQALFVFSGPRPRFHCRVKILIDKEEDTSALHSLTMALSTLPLYSA